MIKEKGSPESNVQEVISDIYELVLYNDDINEFDFVTITLVDVCKLEPIQAEQITLIVHNKGKCGVISGTFEELKPIYEILTIRGLTVSIE